MRKWTTIEFIEKAYNIHKDKYEYPDEYVNSYTKIRIICKTHGEFWQRPVSHITNKQGCPSCVKNKKLSTIEFIEKAYNIHKDKYEYPDEYVNSSTKMRIICKTHGAFWQTPNHHLCGHNCQKCTLEKLALNRTHDTSIFITNANNIHNNKYEYPDEYHTNQSNGCPNCNKHYYSKISIKWMNKIAEKENIHIQHAENGDEYSISGTKYKADGYCKETNTIYEFYGDIWHGNLEIYTEDEQCHPFSDESAGSLYIKTMQREQKIKNLGYNLVTIWENDYVHCHLGT